jgi:hypothetical protein
MAEKEESKVWYVEFPTFQYKEDVKELAKKHGLKIVDVQFKGEDDGAKGPKLTKLKKGDEPSGEETPK